MELLGLLGPRARHHAALVVGMLKDRERPALRRIGEAAVPALEEALGDENEAIRHAASEALADIRAPRRRAERD